MESQLFKAGDRLSKGVGSKERRARKEEQLRWQMKKTAAQLEEAEHRADAEQEEVGKWEGKKGWLDEKKKDMAKRREEMIENIKKKQQAKK